MPTLDYRRVELFLPAGTMGEREATRQAIEWMRATFGGATNSTAEGPVFQGHWLQGDDWVVDEIVLVFADTAATALDLDRKVRELHSFLVAAYLAAGSP